MRPSMPAYLLLVFLSLAGISHAMARTPLEDLCSNLGGGYVDYGACMARLGSDPRSRTAKDFPALAAISLDLCIDRATGIKSKVLDLLPRDEYKSVRYLLSKCLTLYSDVIPALRWSSGAIASKNYSGAAAAIGNAVGVPAACDQVFERGGARADVSPLAKDNTDFSGLALVSQAIAQILHA